MIPADAVSAVRFAPRRDWTLASDGAAKEQDSFSLDW